MPFHKLLQGFIFLQHMKLSCYTSSAASVLICMVILMPWLSPSHKYFCQLISGL